MIIVLTSKVAGNLYCRKVEKLGWLESEGWGEMGCIWAGLAWLGRGYEFATAEEHGPVPEYGWFQVEALRSWMMDYLSMVGTTGLYLHLPSLRLALKARQCFQFLAHLDFWASSARSSCLGVLHYHLLRPRSSELCQHATQYFDWLQDSVNLIAGWSN